MFKKITLLVTAGLLAVGIAVGSIIVAHELIVTPVQTAISVAQDAA